jgi:uncharacterized protein YodC (DUF2158 family)
MEKYNDDGIYFWLCHWFDVYSFRIIDPVASPGYEKV